MDIVKIKNYIIENNESIETLLLKADFLSIKNNGKEYRCGWNEEHSPMGVQIFKATLKTVCYSFNFTSDLIYLLQRKLGLTFVQTLSWIGKTLDIDVGNFETKEIILPFGGHFKQIKRQTFQDIDDITVYDEDILSHYHLIPCKRFILDNISAQTQEKFHIGYDVSSNRISVPWRNPQGEIIGIMGRLNEDDISIDYAKWFPIIPFSKNYSLYGFYENYNAIIEKDICIVGESEKHTLELDSMNFPVGVSLGGNVVSDYKASLIKSTHTKTIITAYDEGLLEDIIIENTLKLKMNNSFFNNQVGYIYDRENKYLHKGSKMSPSDLDKNTFQKLLSECVIWV